ncbi:MAG: DoxX family protein [Pyrinomonadaceae bacterium]
MQTKIAGFLTANESFRLQDLSLLVMRILFGLSMMLQHGLSNLRGFSEYADKYHDPIGLGSRNSMILMIFAEFFCAIAVSIGLLTRFALVPLIFGLSVAFFVYHASHPFEHKELAYLYLSAFLVLLLSGPGRFSADALIFGKEKKGEFEK